MSVPVNVTCPSELANGQNREPAALLLETLDGLLARAKPTKAVKIKLPADLLKWANKCAFHRNFTLSDWIRGLLEIERFTDNRLWESTLKAGQGAR